MDFSSPSGKGTASSAVPLSYHAIEGEDCILPAGPSRFLYPIAEWAGGRIGAPGVPFEFASDCPPFRERAAFLFRHVLRAGEAAAEAPPAPGKVPRVELHWLPQTEGGEAPPGPNRADRLPAAVVMRLDGEECFRTWDLGSAITHFESHFAFRLLSSAAGAFGYLHMHGAAVETPSGTLLIVESEDHGKSSLAMALLALGALPVTDDILLLVPGEGRVARVPRTFRFDEGTFAALCKLKAPAPLFTYYYDPGSAERAYHFVDPFGEGGFAPGFSAPVAAVVFPSFAPGRAGARLLPLRWREALPVLISQTLTPMGEDLFPRWLDPIQGARCFRLEWGDLAEAARRLWEALEG